MPSHRGLPGSIPGNARTLEQRVTRFWLLVDRRTEDECWPWMGYTEDGYGRVFDGTRMRFAHDLALEWFGGEPRPKGLDTCHGCNNPICVNPKHLRYDTRKSNVDDMTRAGRRNDRCKVSDEDVVLMRERFAGGATLETLSQQYGVSTSWVSMLVSGYRRRHVGGPIRERVSA